jgi:hypothetical protein
MYVMWPTAPKPHPSFSTTKAAPITVIDSGRARAR